MFRTKQKTVESVEEKLGLFGKLKNAFKTKKTKASTQARKQKKTKNGNIRKQSDKTTELQVKKIFRLHKMNPNLSNNDIGKTVGMSEVLVRYYLKKGRKASLTDFKKSTKRKLKLENKSKPQIIKSPRNIEFKSTKLTSRKATLNLNELFKKEKYPTEHQSDPRYFAGSNPPQSVATVESFDDQKRRNNINRAVVAKKIAFDKKLTEEQAHDDRRKARLREKHQTQPPKIHLTPCPSCNPKSNLSVDEYNHIVRQESWRRHQYAEKQRELIEKEKSLDKQKQKQDGSVSEMAQQGTQLCRKCDQRIPYSQATRSYSIYGEYYCQTHEPKV